MDFHVGINNPTPRLILGFLIYLFLATLFLNTSTTTLVESCMEEERQALLSFKDDLIDHYGRLSSWVGHYLLSNDLNWLSHLSSLKRLNLDYVDLSSIEESWLHSVNKLPSLLELHLYYCQIHNIPQSLRSSINLTSLEVLDISSNDLITNSSFPKWIFNLSSLTTLDASWNSFKDLFVDEFTSLKSLEHLDLTSTGLKGQLPKFIGTSCGLKSLQLASNIIDGELPSSLENHKNLQHLDLHSNHLNNFTPKSLGQLTQLVSLDLSENSFNGSLPESLGHLSQLVSLDLSSNLWEGNVTEAHFINLTSLKTFSFMVTSSMRVNIHDGNLPIFVNVIDNEWIPPFHELIP